jgi:hypothetical protein
MRIPILLKNVIPRKLASSVEDTLSHENMVGEPSWDSFVAELHLHTNTAVSTSQSHHGGFHVFSP